MNTHHLPTLIVVRIWCFLLNPLTWCILFYLALFYNLRGGNLTSFHYHRSNRYSLAAIFQPFRFNSEATIYNSNWKCEWTQWRIVDCFGESLPLNTWINKHVLTLAVIFLFFCPFILSFFFVSSFSSSSSSSFFSFFFSFFIALIPNYRNCWKGRLGPRTEVGGFGFNKLLPVKEEYCRF